MRSGTIPEIDFTPTPKPQTLKGIRGGMIPEIDFTPTPKPQTLKGIRGGMIPEIDFRYTSSYTALTRCGTMISLCRCRGWQDCLLGRATVISGSSSREGGGGCCSGGRCWQGSGGCVATESMEGVDGQAKVQNAGTRNSWDQGLGVWGFGDWGVWGLGFRSQMQVPVVFGSHFVFPLQKLVSGSRNNSLKSGSPQIIACTGPGQAASLGTKRRPARRGCGDQS